MIRAVEAYLTFRRAAGFDLSTASYLLRSFAHFADEHGDTHVRAETAIAWAAQGPSVAQRDARLKTIWRFARHLRVEDGRHALPPPGHFGYRKARPVPYIYTPGEIGRLIEAALALGPPGSLKAQTCATLLALLAVTGLRISEALHLRFSDVTADGLLIRDTKFRKTRLTPLHETTAAGLARYLMLRRQVGFGDDHVFIGDHGRALNYPEVQSTFLKLLRKAGLYLTSGRRHPRLHDLRHTMAVRALEASPTDRKRVGHHMVALATYLGHVNIYATYWYLQAAPELLDDIASVSESFLSGGVQS